MYYLGEFPGGNEEKQTKYFKTYGLRTHNFWNTKQDSYKTDHNVSSLRFSVAVAIIFFFILRYLEFFKIVSRRRTKYTYANLEHIMARELKGLNKQDPNIKFKLHTISTGAWRGVVVKALRY